jgi:hypothetical protein
MIRDMKCIILRQEAYSYEQFTEQVNGEYK